MVVKVCLTFMGIVFNTLPGDDGEAVEYNGNSITGCNLVGSFVRIPFAAILVYYSWCYDSFFPGTPGKDTTPPLHPGCTPPLRSPGATSAASLGCL